jgi:hypothetical protein
MWEKGANDLKVGGRGLSVACEIEGGGPDARYDAHQQKDAILPVALLARARQPGAETGEIAAAELVLQGLLFGIVDALNLIHQSWAP